MKKIIVRIFLIIVLVISFVFIVSSKSKVDSNALEEVQTEDEKEDLKDELINPFGAYAQALSTVFFNITFNVLKEFDENIYNDLLSINYDIFNSDIDKVLNAKRVSFYKGIPIIKINTNRAGTFLCIMLDYTETEETLLHEYGHTYQEILMGPITYLIFIGIPSYFELSAMPYYNRPWEVTADIFGGLTRTSRLIENEPARFFSDEAIGVLYLIGLMAISKIGREILLK